jgi:hypothetical protein
MVTNAPDRMHLRILLMLAVAGAILAVVGWYRYLAA